MKFIVIINTIKTSISTYYFFNLISRGVIIIDTMKKAAEENG